MKTTSLHFRAALVSMFMFLVFLGTWQLASTSPSVGGAAKAGMTAEEIEYQKMMGKDPGAVKSTGFPPPIEVGKAILGHLADPFYDKGPNDKGIGIQLAPNKALAEVLIEAHGAAAFALIGLVGLHVAAALKHQFIDKDGLLDRMRPGR